MSNSKLIVELDINSCSDCPFLNGSDTGENCNLLINTVQEDEWSNIDYQFKKGWRYRDCPLFHEEFLRDDCGVRLFGESFFMIF